MDTSMLPRAREASGAADKNLPPVFFLHIHKTAGTSLQNMLVARFPAGTALVEAHHPTRSVQDPNRYRFVQGHHGFDYTRRYRIPPFVMTFLRDPIERALSMYYFYRRHTEAQLREKEPYFPASYQALVRAIVRAVNRYELVEFLEKEPEIAEHVLGNHQTRFLLGQNPLLADPPALGRPLGTSALPDEAASNLERCEVVGLTERIDESLDLLRRERHWVPFDAILHVNRGENRVEAASVPPAALERLASLTSLDAQLYQFGSRLLTERLARARALPEPVPLLPDAANFTFDQPVQGGGWYERERGRGGWYCWSGPDKEAWLELAVRTEGDHLLRCGIRRVLRADVLDGLQLRVNGETVTWRRRHKWLGAEIEAVVPGRLLLARGGRVRINFRVPELVRPSDTSSGAKDRRPLGLAVDRLQLIPARRRGWRLW